jgi:hypothetical protein
MDQNRPKRVSRSTRLARTLLGAALCGLMLGAPRTARAGFVVSQIGDQDFEDGQNPVPVWETRLVGQGEPPPFDGSVFGDDRKPRRFGAFEYAHHFDLVGESAVGAKLTVGLIDHDSPQGDRRGTVALFLDGLPQPTEMFNGISSRSANGSANVVTVPVPPETLDDGELVVRFETTRPARRFSGNSIQIDFSRLRIQDALEDGPPPVPRPIPLPNGGLAGGLMLLGCGAWALLRRRTARSTWRQFQNPRYSPRT